MLCSDSSDGRKRPPRGSRKTSHVLPFGFSRLGFWRHGLLYVTNNKRNKARSRHLVAERGKEKKLTGCTLKRAKLLSATTTTLTLSLAWNYCFHQRVDCAPKSFVVARLLMVEDRGGHPELLRDGAQLRTKRKRRLNKNTANPVVNVQRAAVTEPGEWGPPEARPCAGPPSPPPA